ncbi:MAG: tRNA lysidine(34) synthetase TilS [Oscillospiraceae bacterium]
MTIDAIAHGARVLCAVSGGVDSMYLLHRMAELGAQRGFTVGCAHFNHGLRGVESDRDEAFVRAQCEKLGVPFYAGRGDVTSVRGMGTEAAARELRYAFLTHCADEHGYDWIATAHTADDNAETLLLNLARGCGLRGLTGIPPQRGKLLRPMLDTTRAQAEAYLTARAIPHVEDSTNAADTYARNRVRHHAVPALESVNTAFVQHTSDTAALLREDERFLSGLAANFWPDRRSRRASRRQSFWRCRVRCACACCSRRPDGSCRAGICWRSSGCAAGKSSAMPMCPGCA